MTVDTEIRDYLHARSALIDVPHAGPADIARRARSRRTRGTAIRGGLAALALLGGTAVVVTRAADDPAEIADGGAARLVESTLDWTAVDQPSGLGWGSPPVAAGGQVYSLSTSSARGAQAYEEPEVLYRGSEDGTWAPVSLPDGLWASGLAGDDDALYAVGTAAAGGATLATTRDGGTTWDTSELPLDLGEVGATFPGQVGASQAGVAVIGSTTVAVVELRADLDVPSLLRAGEDADDWTWDSRGLVRRSGECPAVGETVPGSPTTPDGAADCALDPPILERRTWEELGVSDSDAQLALVGRTVVFRSLDGGPPEAVRTIPRPSSRTGSDPALYATDDGFVLFDVSAAAGDGGPDATVAWRSIDGASWEATEIATGWPVASGVLDGRAAILVDSAEGRPDLAVVDPGGAVRRVELDRLADTSSASWIAGVGFGPLGLAVVMAEDEQGDDISVLHTRDGRDWSLTPMELDAATESVVAVAVSADAVTVRIDERDPDPDPDDLRPIGQRRFVGTPPS